MPCSNRTHEGHPSSPHTSTHFAHIHADRTQLNPSPPPLLAKHPHALTHLKHTTFTAPQTSPLIPTGSQHPHQSACPNIHTPSSNTLSHTRPPPLLQQSPTHYSHLPTLISHPHIHAYSSLSHHSRYIHRAPRPAPPRPVSATPQVPSAGAPKTPGTGSRS
jgi:hypothetical protein